MTGAGKSGVEVRSLAADEWRVWKDLRVRAVAESPDSFAVTLAEEEVKPDEVWAEMIGRGAASDRAENLVAYVDGTPAGMGYVGVDDDGVASVFAMWVAPGFRRRGVASALLFRMRSVAVAAGARYVQLWATVGNEGAAELYRGAGFRATGEVEALRSGSDVRVAAMRLAL
jgi:ribosomal protein S18 acetylase RimI-like enzyme